MARTLINVPKQAKKGDMVEVRILISHPMESGLRRNDSGELVPRDIINRLICSYNGEDVFRAELFPAISANPYLSFYLVAGESGPIKFSWTDDHGATQSESVPLTVD
jgi:sulfur-oxidizing protein SoxZ